MPEEPLTTEQLATFEAYYPEQITKLSCKLYRHLWRQYADEGDALAQAAIGLLIAVRRFRPEMGNRFSTLLCLCLRSALTDGLSKGASRETIRNKSLKSDKQYAGVRCSQLSVFESGRKTDCGVGGSYRGTQHSYDVSTPCTDDAEHRAIEAREIISRIMPRLPWKDREVLYDRYVRGWSCAVIAWHRQRNRTTVKEHINRVLREAAKMGAA